MDVCMEGWMYGLLYECMDACVWTDGWMRGCMNVWMQRCKDVRMYGCNDVWKYRWKGGCMHVLMYRWKGGCMHGWMDRLISRYFAKSTSIAYPSIPTRRNFSARAT